MFSHSSFSERACFAVSNTCPASRPPRFALALDLPFFMACLAWCSSLKVFALFWICYMVVYMGAGSVTVFVMSCRLYNLLGRIEAGSVIVFFNIPGMVSSHLLILLWLVAAGSVACLLWCSILEIQNDDGCGLIKSHAASAQQQYMFHDARCERGIHAASPYVPLRARLISYASSCGCLVW